MNINIEKPILDTIVQCTESIPGWCPIDELFALFILAMSTQRLEGNFLEIGSFCGKSSSVLAMAAEKIDTKLHCIDLFPNRNDWYKENDGTYNFQVNVKDRIYTLGNYRFWEEPYRKQVVPIYDEYGDSLECIFLNNLKERDLDSSVLVQKGTSTEFSENIKSKIRFAFFDGDHSYEGVKNDIENIEKFLVSGAILAFDDAFVNYPENDKAINELIVYSNKYDCFQQLTRKCFVARKK